MPSTFAGLNIDPFRHNQPADKESNPPQPSQSAIKAKREADRAALRRKKQRKSAASDKLMLGSRR